MVHTEGKFIYLAPSVYIRQLL